MRTELSIKVEPLCGSNADEVFAAAIDLSRRLGVMVTFDFNGVHCYLDGDDRVEDLERRLWDACERKLPTLPSR